MSAPNVTGHTFMRSIGCLLLLLVVAGLWTGTAVARSYQFDAIQVRFPDVAIDKAQTESARMQGECLVGLKALNFRGNQAAFDPVAEWSNFRTVSLLEQFSPCEVLAMMDVAHERLKTPEWAADAPGSEAGRAE